MKRIENHKLHDKFHQIVENHKLQNIHQMDRIIINDKLHNKICQIVDNHYLREKKSNG